MFYNTGIATYVWVLSNKKSNKQKGKVLLINGVNLFGKMRKSLGSKRNEMGEADQATIVRCFGNYEEVDQLEAEKPFAAKIFPSYAFGFRRITVERPLRQSFQYSDERLDALRYAPRPLDDPMKWIESEFFNEDAASSEESGSAAVGSLGPRSCTPLSDFEQITDFLKQNRDTVRTALKTQFPKLKPKQIREVMDPKTWRNQLDLWEKARDLQAVIGIEQHDDMNTFDRVLKEAAEKADVKLDGAEKKQISAAVSWKNPDAVKVIKKVHRKVRPEPLYGLFAVDGRVMEYQPDSELRDNENIPLDPSRPVQETVEAYFHAEVAPHVPDAWIDEGKRDTKDGDLGIVGYEIPFNRHFYEYEPPRDLAEIDADLD
ncbi:MAG: N-6 DNA methylase, partial [Planctomycetes bacterium]|nr:N-6 DNA methylase [Planctomycetota bacterium]